MVSAFAGYGNKMARAVRNTFPEVTDALLCLASAPRVFLHILCMSTIERFLVLLYDHISTCSDVNWKGKEDP